MTYDLSLADVDSPFGVAVLDGYIYWTDTSAVTLNRVSLEGGGDEHPEVVSGLRSVGHLTAVAKSDAKKSGMLGCAE